MFILSDVFSYDKVTGEMACELSDIEMEIKRHNLNLENGLTIKSVKTGNCVTFKYDNTVVNYEGETEGWYLIPTKYSVAKYPSARHLTLLIFND